MFRTNPDLTFFEIHVLIRSENPNPTGSVTLMLPLQHLFSSNNLLGTSHTRRAPSCLGKRVIQLTAHMRLQFTAPLIRPWLCIYLGPRPGSQYVVERERRSSIPESHSGGRSSTSSQLISLLLLLLLLATGATTFSGITSCTEL